MYYWVSAALRQHIIENYDVQIDRLDDTIEAVAKQTVAELRQNGESASTEAPVELARRLAEANKITTQLLLQSLRQGEVALFEALFAQLSGLRLNLIRRLLFEPGGEGLAIVCRAIEIDKATFASIFMLTRRARPTERMTDPRDLTSVLALFDRINPAAAKAVVARWRRDPDFLYAVRKVQEAMGDVAPV
jgi:uncharacterized protein (DUF2336 family)